MEIIIPHTNTDLDALGAAVGAQVLYPHALIVLPGSPNPLAAEFISLHRYNVRVRTLRDIDTRLVTRLIVVDHADPERLGPLQDLVGRTEVHLYDHHPPEPDDLQATLEVRDLVGSTCTLLAELIEEAGASVTPVQATAMLLGIYADTGSLTLMGTTDRDARAAGFLLSQGANLRAVDRFIQVALSPAQQALLHQMQNRGRRLTVRGARMMLLEGETPGYVGGLAMVVHRLQEIIPTPALFGAVKMGDRVHLIARSEVPWVDAARVMQAFGGGGHPSAASAVVKGATLDGVIERLEAVLHQTVDLPVLARDVMSSPVKAIQAGKPAREAERVMLRYGHSGLPVVDEQGRLEGMVSLRDVEKARRHGLDHAPVKGIMIRRLVTVTPDTPLDEVQDRMVERDIGRVPVVEGENLVGIISRSDLLGLLYGGPAPRWHRTLYAGSGAPQMTSAADLSERQAARAFAAAPPRMLPLLTAAGRVGERMGLQVYAVGGMVRDLLLSRPVLDIDLVVEGDGILFARELAAELGGRVAEVPRFQSAHIYLEQTSSEMVPRLDITTARREFYEHAAALPLVEHADLREDLYRRDFSINAMAIRLGPEGPVGLVDFFGGLQDLEQGQIRILHSLSFVEDPTRIIRAIRFAHRYGFTLEPETAQCAQRAVTEGFLDRVSPDRLRHELVLLLEEPRSGSALQLADELGTFARLLPGLDLPADRAAAVDRVDSLAGEYPDLYALAVPWLLKLMVLLSPLPPAEASRLISRMKLKREEEERLQTALSGRLRTLTLLADPEATPGMIAEALRGWSPDGLLLLCLQGAGERVVAYWRQWRHVRLAITGKDLLRRGVEPGPAIRRALARVLCDRLDGTATDREAQLALALQYARDDAGRES